MTAASFTLTLKQYDPRPYLREQFSGARRSIAMRRLESEIARIITAANGHRDKNVPKHAEVYQSLLKAAQTKIADFAREYKVPVNDLLAQMPAMKELQEWGGPSPAPVPITNGVGIAIGGTMGLVIAIILAGVLTGTVQRLFHFGWTLSHHTW